MTQSAQPRYPDESRLKVATHWFPDGVAALQPPVNTVELARLLGGNYNTVKQWRLGLRGAPQWAVDRLQSILEAQAARQLAVARRAAPGPRDSSAIGTAALRNWRLQRALEREKAPD